MGKRRTAEEWRDIVAAWLASGEGCKEFAAQRGVKATTLAWWKWKLGAEPAPQPLAFSSVEVVDMAEPPDFVVELDALRVRVPVGFDAMELRRLVAALC